MPEGILRFVDVSKEFSGHTVLKGINMDVRPGEVHALIGENGAGKSTLMNILFGMPVIHETGGFGGTVEIDGEDAHIMTPHDAMEKGIGMVHQEFMLIPGFTIAENIKLNREITKPTVMSKIFGKRMESLQTAAMNADARKALDTMEMGIAEYTMVAGLPVGHMQFVEIAREIDKTGIRFLVFDEPTAVLTESETKNLLAAIKRLAAKGIGIVFISHRLDEIIEVSDRVTILRDGEWVATEETKNITAAEIARLMVGRALTIDRNESKREISDEVMLEVEHLRVNMPGEVVKGVDMKVRKGEIVGIGGLAGQGKLGIPNGIMGLCEAGGTVEFMGKEIPLNQPRNCLDSGLAFVSEDRRGVGLLLDESLEWNIAFPAMQIQNRFLKKYLGGLIKWRDEKAIREVTDRYIKELAIKCTGTQQKAKELSGGNQQKICLAKTFALEPKFLFVSEPTRGIDVGAKALVLESLKKFNRESGVTVVMISSELEELRQICDRIAIVSGGAVSGILPATAPSEEFGMLMVSNVK